MGEFYKLMKILNAKLPHLYFFVLRRLFNILQASIIIINRKKWDMEENRMLGTYMPFKS